MHRTLTGPSHARTGGMMAAGRPNACGSAPAAENSTHILGTPHVRHALTRWCPWRRESIRPPVRQSMTVIGWASS